VKLLFDLYTNLCSCVRKAKLGSQAIVNHNPREITLCSVNF